MKIVGNVFFEANKKFNVGNHEILSRVSTKNISNARKYIVKRLRDDYHYTFEMIASVLYRHHTNIMYLYRGKNRNNKK